MRSSSHVPRASGGAAVLVIIGVVLALFLRLLLLPIVTLDTSHYLVPWQTYADAAGGGYLRQPFSNYAPFYEHVLAFLALFPGEAILRIKISSIVFDFVLAWAVTLCVPSDKRLAAFLILLLLPTVVINSAALGQSDAIYTACLILMLAAALRQRPVWTILAFSAALAVKQQAMFLAPLLALLWLEGRQRWWTFALIPAAYVVTALPMLIGGRGVRATFLVYLEQFDTYKDLSANAPNPWMIVKKLIDYQTGVAVGLPLAALVIVAAILWLWRRHVIRVGVPREGLLLCAAILAILAPYMLPKMHERYFYIVDPILLALTMTNRRYWVVLALAQSASLIAYVPFLAMVYGEENPIFGPTGILEHAIGAGYGLFVAVGTVLMTAALALLCVRAWRLSRDAGRSDAMQAPA